MGSWMAVANVAAGGTAALGFGQTLLIGGVSVAGTSLVSDLGDIFIKGEDISFGQVLLNMSIYGAGGVAFSGISYGLFKAFTALKLKFIHKGGLEPGTLSNVDARKWYLKQEAKIPDLIDDSLPLEQQARQAFDLRN